MYNCKASEGNSHSCGDTDGSSNSRLGECKMGPSKTAVEQFLRKLSLCLVTKDKTKQIYAKLV